MATKFKTETIEKEKKVNFLINVDPTFISLVRHGANRTPFRVIKSEEGSNEMMFVQSVLVPKGIDLKNVASKEGLQWLLDVKLDSVEEQDGYKKFNQMEASKFEKNLNMIKLDDSGIYAVTGKLVHKEDAKEALTFEPQAVSKMMEVSQGVSETPIAEVERKPYVVSFKEMFEVELDNFLSVVRGTLSQSGLAPEKRKKAVMGALDGFKNFLTVALDTVNETGKQEHDNFKELNEKLEQLHKAIVHKGSKDMTKDEVKAIVIETLEETAKQVTDKQDGNKSEETTSKTEEQIASLVASLKEIADKVDGMAKKQEDMGNQIVGQIASAMPNDKNTQQQKPKSVFSGMLTGKR